MTRQEHIKQHPRSAQTHYIKTYGIESGYNKGKQRYFVVCDGKRTSLNYARADFTLRKAEQFIKSCHRNFTRPDGTQVTFEFKAA